jgi:sulfonate transport system permease protein
VTTTPIRQQERSHVGTPTGTTEEHSHVRLARLAPRQLGPVGLAIGPLAALVLWQVSSSTGLLPPQQLASPWTAVTTGWEMFTSGELLPHLAASAKRAYLGLALGTVLGLGLALASGLSRAGEASIDSLVQVKRAIPTLALLPLLVLWLGISEEMKIITIALAVMLPVYIHTHNGLRSIDGRYAELAETVDISRAEFIRTVVLPGAMPGFLLGMRFAVTTALLSLVVVEQINSTSGIGYMITLASHYGQTEVIVVGLVVYALLGLAADGFVRLIERKALAWRRTLESH